MTQKTMRCMRVVGMMLIAAILYATNSWTAGEDADVTPKSGATTQRGQERRSPGTYTIQMPDFHAGTPQDQPWRSSSNHVQLQLSIIAEEALESVADRSLGLEPRLGALNVAHRFNADVTASRLVAAVDLRDNRFFISGSKSRGDYPVVTVLVEYGLAAVPHVIDALCTETDETRRKLLCDVLEKGVGLDFAEKDIVRSIERSERWTVELDTKKTQLERLTQALEEVRSRQKRAAEKTPQTLK